MYFNIPDILKRGEGLNVEFKTSFNNATIETLTAFVNAKGGAVYIGVKDDGKVIGAQLGKESIQQWVNEIKCKTEPSIIPYAETVNVKEKEIVVLSVTV